MSSCSATVSVVGSRGATPCEGICETRLGLTMGQTGADGRFTLLPIVCLGACDRAPVMMIDDDLHDNLTVDKIDRSVEQWQ